MILCLSTLIYFGYSLSSSSACAVELCFFLSPSIPHLKTTLIFCKNTMEFVLYVTLFSQDIVNRDSDDETWQTIKSQVRLIHVNTSTALKVSCFFVDTRRHTFFT